MFAIILFDVTAFALVKEEKVNTISIQKVLIINFIYYCLNNGALIFANGVNVILNINEFSGSSSESL